MCGGEKLAGDEQESQKPQQPKAVGGGRFKGEQAALQFRLRISTACL